MQRGGCAYFEGNVEHVQLLVLFKVLKHFLPFIVDRFASLAQIGAELQVDGFLRQFVALFDVLVRRDLARVLNTSFDVLSPVAHVVSQWLVISNGEQELFQFGQERVQSHFTRQELLSQSFGFFERLEINH